MTKRQGFRVNVGDVIVLKYRTFENKEAVGIFAVVYHEAEINKLSTCFSAIKISTESCLYQIKLSKEYVPFLKHDSYLNCNTQFKFIEDQVHKIIGRLNPFYLNKIIQQTRSYQKDMEKQLIQHIGKNDLFGCIQGGK